VASRVNRYAWLTIPGWLHRFRLGALGGSPGEIVRIAADPKAFVKGQLQRRAAAALAADRKVACQWQSSR
jgi:hypothetical protein